MNADIQAKKSMNCTQQKLCFHPKHNKASGMTVLAVQEHDITIKATSIKIRTVGQLDNDKPVFVFLHEGLGSITQWRDFPAALCAATGFAALVYDRPGYGRSQTQTEPWPDDFLLRHAEFLPLIIHAFGIKKPILFGHSDGGTLALMTASLYPDLPVAIITEAAHVMLEPITKQGLQHLLEKTKSDPEFVSRLLRHHPHKDIHFILNWIMTWLRPTLADWNMLDLLPAITCPVLALQSDGDEHGSGAQIEEIEKRVSGPASSLMIADCGHVPHLEARKTVIEAVLQFIKANNL
jgi:pimeloyl-ACP methyl ester carboxylesterase